MMKKNGFTLAEVLITLAIIGVVATMTLPALMTNTAEQQAKTALKKGINTLTEAAQMNQAIDGFDYASLTSADKDATAQSLYGLLARRTSVDYGKSGLGKLPDSAGNYVVFLRDGSAISFKNDQKTDEEAAALKDDNLVYGIPVLYDTNGLKGPNIISNCIGITLGLKNGAKDSVVEDVNTQCKGANRVIKDQFGIRLRGGYAVPNGAAARWAFEN